jgi:galactosylxylosylprotein 3-beta-galactosyltransferase
MRRNTGRSGNRFSPLQLFAIFLVFINIVLLYKISTGTSSSGDNGKIIPSSDEADNKYKNQHSNDGPEKKTDDIVQKTTVYEEDDITALHRSSWLQIKKERIRMPIIITILSAPSYKARRDLIRASWLKLAPETRNKEWVAYFLIGTQGLKQADVEKLNEENEEFKDMWFFDMKDAYADLSLKMMHVFRFVLENYDFKYLLKTDDDAFVRPDRLLNYYRYFNPRRTYIGTYRIFKETTLPYSRRPQVYAGGAGYILSPDTVEYLAEQYWRHKRPLMYYEDLLMGFWLNTIGVRLQYYPFLYECDDEAMLMHYVKGKTFNEIYQRILSGRKSMCDEERVESEAAAKAAQTTDDEAQLWVRGQQ